MLTMTMATLAALAVMILFPETGVGRTLRRWLVETPAQVLNRTRVLGITFYAGLAIAILTMTLLFEVEGLIVSGAVTAELLPLVVMVDVGVMIDTLLITSAILASNGLRTVRAQTSAWLRRVAGVFPRRSARARRPRRPASTPDRKAKDDDRPAWGPQPAYRVFSMA